MSPDLPVGLNKNPKTEDIFYRLGKYSDLSLVDASVGNLQ